MSLLYEHLELKLGPRGPLPDWVAVKRRKGESWETIARQLSAATETAVGREWLRQRFDQETFTNQ